MYFSTSWVFLYFLNLRWDLWEISKTHTSELSHLRRGGLSPHSPPITGWGLLVGAFTLQHFQPDHLVGQECPMTKGRPQEEGDSGVWGRNPSACTRRVYSSYTWLLLWANGMWAEHQHHLLCKPTAHIKINHSLCLSYDRSYKVLVFNI